MKHVWHPLAETEFDQALDYYAVHAGQISAGNSQPNQADARSSARTSRYRQADAASGAQHFFARFPLRSSVPDLSRNAVKALQARLQDALGAGKGQGGDESAGNLANYRYMIGMERLDSPKNKLAEYGSFAEALKTVRENLAKGAGKTAKVYEIVMPDRKMAVFGVAMNDGANSDGEWLRRIGMQDNVAGLPYEIYVVGNEVGSPHGRFRIALAFPDVGMGQFMRISSLPNVIIETMGAVAGMDRKSGGDAWQ
ncbi:MAG: hypothetical protein M1547_00060 [Gammaproteobacteria bacterium]|nr:hypothetical protein [Gammaproteobacteria bacterium]